MQVAASSPEKHSPSAPGHCLPNAAFPKGSRALGEILRPKPSSCCHWEEQKPHEQTGAVAKHELQLLVVQRLTILSSVRRDAFVAVNKAVLKESRGQACFVFLGRPESLGRKQS